MNTNKHKTDRILCSSVFLSVLFCVTIFVFLFIFPFTVHAQSATSLGLSVAPQVFELDVFPGETISQKIKLGNLSGVALPIAVRTTDFTAEEDSGEMLFDESSQDPSFASRFWFKIDNPNFILEANESRTIKFSISVPENAELGGHYAVMLFEPVLPSFYFREGHPRAIPVVGVLFLISVKAFSLEPEVNQKLEVTEFSLPKEERILALENFLSKIMASVAQAADINITQKSPSKFILKIKNNDIYHIKPSGKVLIYNFWGNRVGEIGVPQKTILPGKTRQFPVGFSPEIPEKLKRLPASISDFLTKNLFVGRYSAVLELKESSGDQNLKLARNIFFWSFPWKFWLPLMLTLVLLLFFVIKYNNRIKLAVSVLFKRN